ncbi:hypothetical protein PRV_02355 [Mycoplasma parvum str. Indiana]|uniref:Uncharacterized protein n=1 Tax=Mycoplasma parvum str. Indiana TaxID=1403316 RepID=U5NG23_9MOLU|nr:hypothetical protein PRV_02355 [Mycoplasma parvum str. Indiana]
MICKFFEKSFLGKFTSIFSLIVLDEKLFKLTDLPLLDKSFKVTKYFPPPPQKEYSELKILNFYCLEIKNIRNSLQLTKEITNKFHICNSKK